jgi:hypothetical protein
LWALIKGVDKTGPVWAAALPNPAMKREAVFAAFDTMTLSSKEDKDKIVLTATGRGTGDAGAARDQVNAVQGQIAGRLRQEAAQQKELQPLLEAVESVKVTVDEKGATATATVSREIARSIILMMGVRMGVTTVRPMPAGQAVPVDVDFD